MPQSPDKTMPLRACEGPGCRIKFQPKPGGYNARYHSKKCRMRANAIKTWREKQRTE